jgi:tyrosine-protein phosphatase YwqE
VLGWFKKKEQFTERIPLSVDIHSHLLPGIDDGVKTFEESEEIIRHFKSIGYRKIITTPHIMSDAYRNTPEGIREKLTELQHYLTSRSIDIEIEAAAEYYLDEAFVSMIEENKTILSFGKNYLLFETNFLTEPFNLKDFIFLATTRGYKPVLAHPERYLYLQNNMDKAEDLINRGVLFQINISSLTGYYSRQVQQLAHKLIDRGWIHFLGSDCHHWQHAKLTGEAQQLRYYQKALSLTLLNNTLS